MFDQIKQLLQAEMKNGVDMGLDSLKESCHLILWIKCCDVQFSYVCFNWMCFLWEPVKPTVGENYYSYDHICHCILQIETITEAFVCQ